MLMSGVRAADNVPVRPAPVRALVVSHGFAPKLTDRPPGRYELYCSMPGHLAHGMHVRLTVR